MLTRVTISVVLALLSVHCAAKAQVIPGAQADSSAALAKGEWPAYGGTYAAARYSPLAQIDRTNAKDLHIVWRWRSPDQAIRETNPAVGPSLVNAADGRRGALHLDLAVTGRRDRRCHGRNQMGVRSQNL